MHEVSESPLLKRARDAAAHGDWSQAYELFVRAGADQCLCGPDLVLFAGCAYAAGHVDATIDAWERVHADGLRAGDPLVAAGAAVRVALHLLFDTALLAPIRGWAKRAERLLEGQVLRSGLLAREERCDGDAAVLDRLAELDGDLDLLRGHGTPLV